MEGGDIYKTSSSLGAGSASIWRSNDGMEVFSRSWRGEDDEEALKWAALEKLPTFDRLRKGIMINSDGGVDEIDVHNLGLQQRKNLFQRVLKTDQVDNEEFLLKIKNRIDRVGIELPTVEVRFEHLNVEAEAYAGSRALPTFINFFVNIFESFLSCLHIISSRKRHLAILKDVSGILKPSRITLLLGPPASGKTTMLLALAGKLDQSLKFSGTVTYNGHGMQEFVPQRTAAYISQYDVHIGELTVRETLAFAARCQGVGSRYDMLAELSRRERAANIKPDPDIDVFMKAAATEGQEASVLTDYILKVLGLEVCAETMVGDQMRRGISGGQRKRVTTGEMLVGTAKAFFMDEISTGLDSSTTYEIINSLKQYIHIFNGTALISLLQPAPETYELFDDIILLSDGHIVYQGPREHVLEFFESMGFKYPERKGVADFLQEVTSKKYQMQYWTRTNEPYRFITVKGFTEAFQSFHVGRRLGDELGTPFPKNKSHPAALTTKKYGVSQSELLKACFAREYLLMKRNSFVYFFKLAQLTWMTFITMTLFLRTNMHRRSVTDGGIYMGALFFALIMNIFNGMSEQPMTIAKLPVFYKQRDLLFYPPWAYGLPSWILKIPISFAESTIWTFMTYYVIGFDPNVERFFKQYLAFFFVNQMASALFRTIAALSRNVIIAGTFGSISLVVLFVLSGFVLSRDDIRKWWLWAYWVSPMMYGQSAIVVNEFLGHSWSHVLPNSTESLGVAVLKSRGFFAHSYWYWIGVGVILAYIILFNFVWNIALTFLNPFEKPKAFISEEPENKEQGGRVGGAFQSYSQTTSSNHHNCTVDSAHEVNPIKKRGMVLSFEPHYLTFDDITYSVNMPQEMKSRGVVEDRLVLLKGVTGALRPGVLTALMGVSGAGKTTLMDVLAGRKTGGYIEGNITVTGYRMKQETFARVSGYCEQNDIHSPHVTVYESLLYSAWLRLSSEVDPKTREMFIHEVMELVELHPLRQALVGLPGVNGLSTEQRKRLTIAVELVANPTIIFMDEPTSGLDARAAAIVMRTVRKAVDTGRTVVCTIHQPTIDIFEAFDEVRFIRKMSICFILSSSTSHELYMLSMALQLFLLKRGGQQIYVGPLGLHSHHLISYFQQRIEGVPKIKDGYNPATWMLEVTTSEQEVALGIDFSEVYKNSDLYRRNKLLIKDLSTPAPGSKELYFPTQYSQSFWTQCLACLWKQHWSYWRNPLYTAVRFLYSIFLALVFGTVFWDLGSKKTKRQDIFNAMGSYYASVLFSGVQCSSSVQPVVGVERTIFYRERAAGMYSALPYALAQVMIELPYLLAQSAISGTIVYAMIGFERTAAKFFWYQFLNYFALLYFTFYGMMVAALTPNNQVSAILSSALTVIWNLFSGFIVPLSSIPVWWSWLYWICPVSWTLNGMVTSQYGNLKDKLDSGETVEEFIHSYFGYKLDLLGVVAAVNVGFPILFAFVFAVSIKILNFQRR
ncbi:LOW QUALITY PROTEIN: ABC_tran domain-containing protein/ABC2_membrane domain-containing protein/PDR_assoc domain-containing protein [Cephalotus follicularis]|uniref:ABC_tran domain-containing protein/ABC2_membrane domain-containing protein/PDR_assoc domain-containing protein n=1 Tax=Cephalotus follicularis TaxID=3775 RepID=A0A1Q3D9U8_CEPFO|nr:LOW QUALITY PROTEIN: ABC_tran domain-containing protein/ABC2_membrane domain-containing protein/PDR_assoc domain-containing protein [Cephalotus follicularis]